MKAHALLLCWMLVFFLLAGLHAAPQAKPPGPAKGASLEGTVVKEPGGEPVKKAVIELIQSDAESGHNYTETSNSEGHFEIQDIAPGRYRLFVERTGFVPVDGKHHQRENIALSFAAGQEVKDQVLHLLPTAVVAGRVLDEDGDPLADADVSILRRRLSKDGRLRQLGEARTNDLGQYRISGLMPGRYLVSVTPRIEFSALIHENQDSGNAPELAYVTTYYPNTTDRSQAGVIEVRAGDELPVDFSLTRVPTARIRGTVANVQAAANATVVFQSTDGERRFNETEVTRNGTFEIRRVAPGTYELLAMASINDKLLVARQRTEVTGTNIDGIRLVPAPGVTLRGKVHAPGNAGFDFSRLVVNLRDAAKATESLPLIAEFGDSAYLRADGSLEFKEVPAGSYYVELSRLNEGLSDFYLESATAGGRDVRDAPLVVAGSSLLLDLVLSPKGARADGVVVDDHDQPVPGAVVVAFPGDKLRQRRAGFERTITDQYGKFTMRGMIPGDYSLFAWESLDDDDATLDAAFFKPYEQQAVAVHLEKGGQAHMSLKVQPAPED